jgi:hypothetical protein
MTRCTRLFWSNHSQNGFGSTGWVERQRRPNTSRGIRCGVGSALRLTQPTFVARVASLALACAFATPAGAHGFGQRYELPLPLSLYLFGAAAVVALSFVVFGLFVRGEAAPRARTHVDLMATRVGRVIGHPAVVVALRVGVLALFAIIVLAGLVGDQNPYRNIAPTLVWIIWWVGLAYVQAFIGDLWALINPWRTAFDGAQWLYGRLGRRGEWGGRWDYPAGLGVWPACLLLLAFSWTELVYPNAASPVHIAWMAMAYSVLAWAGMVAFGRDTWLQNGEVFSLVFGTLARFAPTEARDGRLLLRGYGGGLIDSGPVSASMTAFILLLLASVLYDGLIGTGEWALLEGALASAWPSSSGMALKTVGLVGLWLLFLGAYLGISAVMSWVASGRPGALEVAQSFALTLVPIAIGYHVAHYLVFLLVQGQYIIPLLSDPFGHGWNLFGTAGYRVDIAIAGARFTWYMALGAIVTGHVLAVYLAHRRAIAVFEGRRAALATQVPLTALMVVYTFIGLSITAEPIVESREAATPAAVSATVAIAAGAILPEARTGRLRPVASGESALGKLTYKVLGSAFHDGTKTSAADILYAYAFAYRWGVKGGNDQTRYDPFIDAATAAMRRHLMGVRVTGVDATSRSFRVGDVDFVREIFTVEVYLDVPPVEPEWSTQLAPPWSTLPWTVIVLMEEAVERGWAAFSAEAARQRKVEWLDLVRSKELGARLAVLAAAFERDGYRPEPLHAHVTREEARKRWGALVAFQKVHGHLLVTNGPYKLKNWSAESVTLEAFRDLTYPLGVGSYDAYAIPRRGFITRTEWKGDQLVVFGDIEVIEKFQRSFKLVRTPLKSVEGDVLRRSAPECRYLVTGADGQVALAGTAVVGPEKSFEIRLGDQLAPGHYVLSLMIAVNGNATNADIHRIAFQVPLPR